SRFIVPFLFYGSGHPRLLPSFPTRRSSDLAAAFARPLAAVRRAYLLRGDLGEVAQLARAGTLELATLALFHPLGFMLAQPLATRSEEHTSELQSLTNLVCRLLLEKKKKLVY